MTRHDNFLGQACHLRLARRQSPVLGSKPVHGLAVAYVDDFMNAVSAGSSDGLSALAGHIVHSCHQGRCGGGGKKDLLTKPSKVSELRVQLPTQNSTSY